MLFPECFQSKNARFPPKWITSCSGRSDSFRLATEGCSKPCHDDKTRRQEMTARRGAYVKGRGAITPCAVRGAARILRAGTRFVLLRSRASVLDPTLPPPPQPPTGEHVYGTRSSAGLRKSKLLLATKRRFFTGGSSGELHKTVMLWVLWQCPV